MRDPQQGDLERAGRELASRFVLALGLSACARAGRRTRLPPVALPGAARIRRPTRHRPRYRLEVRIPAAGDVTGTVHVTLHARPADRAAGLPALAERAAPGGGGRPSRRRAGHVRRIAPRRGQQPDPTTLVVPLGARLPPAGRSSRSTCRSACGCPGAVRDRLSRSGDAVRLGSFFPILAWEPGVGWDTDPPTRLLAETSSTPTADFDVHVTAPPADDVIDDRHPGRARPVHRDRGARLRNRRRAVRQRHRHRPRAGARAGHGCGRARRAGVRGRGRRPGAERARGARAPVRAVPVAVAPPGGRAGPRPRRDRVPDHDLPRRGGDRAGRRRTRWRTSGSTRWWGTTRPATRCSTRGSPPTPRPSSTASGPTSTGSPTPLGCGR